jgi:hypothetical protein
MSPALLALILQLVEEAIANEPAIAADLQALFGSGTPTAAQWAALRANVAAETYGQFVPTSAMQPPPQTGSAAPNPPTGSGDVGTLAVTGPVTAAVAESQTAPSTTVGINVVVH